MLLLLLPRCERDILLRTVRAWTRCVVGVLHLPRAKAYQRTARIDPRRADVIGRMVEEFRGGA